MKIRGVITGDIVNSSKIKGLDRDLILGTIEDLKTSLKHLGLSSIEFYRGDSFQMYIEDSTTVLKIAILTRAKLRSIEDKQWDARLAVGIGEVDYIAETILTSDGEAYKNSGREFDELKKRRLSIQTPWTDINNELSVSTSFADNIISKWTSNQAQMIFQSISNDITQKDIAINLNKMQQNVSKTLNKANEDLIVKYLNRYKSLIEEKTTKNKEQK